MDAQRRRFLLALGLFVGWVIALAVLAAVSSRRPPDRAEGRMTRPTLDAPGPRVERPV